MSDRELIWEVYTESFEKSLNLHSLKESLDHPYKFKNTFKTETITDSDDDGEEYTKEVFSPVQIVHFTTDEGVPYVWYARQNRHDETTWEIAFGVNKGENIRGGFEMDIELVNTKNPFRVFSTVIQIINNFIEFDENLEIHRLTLTSDHTKRTNLYLNRLLPLIDKFKVSDVRRIHDEDSITLERQVY
jgi:hypothetical protein